MLTDEQIEEMAKAKYSGDTGHTIYKEVSFINGAKAARDHYAKVQEENGVLTDIVEKATTLAVVYEEIRKSATWMPNNGQKFLGYCVEKLEDKDATK